MTTSREELESRRESILRELGSIRSLRRGTITQQYLRGRVAGREEPVRRGPYYVLSRHEKGRTVSRRLKPGRELERARREVAAHKRFVDLCRELEEVTEKLGELEREGAEPEAGKKNDAGRP